MKMDKRVKLRQALEEALHQLAKGEKLPAYLEKPLLKYEAAFWKRVTRNIIAPKLVGRYRKQGMPLSKVSRRTGAYEAAAIRLGLSESTVERAFSEFPPKPDDLVESEAK